MGKRKKQPPKDIIERVAEYASNGTTQLGIAKLLHTSHDTLTRWMDEHPEIRETYERAREVEHQNLFNSLYKQAIDGNTTAGIFLMKTRHGYVDTGKQDIDHHVNVTFTLPSAMSLKDYRARIIEAQPGIVKKLEQEDGDG